MSNNEKDLSCGDSVCSQGVLDAVSEVEVNLARQARGIRRQLFDEVKRSDVTCYQQIESLLWLKDRLAISNRLPPLRGWATSPDLLLELHECVSNKKYSQVLEFGSGASTLVIADALRQNGGGKLVSIEHSCFYAEKTCSMLQREDLLDWVDLRVAPLEPWKGEPYEEDSEASHVWYSQELVNGVEGVQLMLVDGPPGNCCPYARYPALPAVFESLAKDAEIWMDDIIRQEEKDICVAWSDRYIMTQEYIDLEKGLCILRKR